MRAGRFENGIIGLLSGFTLASGVAQFWLQCGTSLPARTGLAVMVMLALGVWRLLDRAEWNGFLGRTVSLFALSAAAVLMPTMFTLSNQWISASSVNPLNSRVVQVAAFSSVATAGLLVAVVAVMRLVRSGVSGGLTAIGVLHGALFICPWLGPRGCGLLSASMGLLAFLMAMFRWARRGNIDTTLTAQEAALVSQPSEHRFGAWRLLACAAIGFLWVAGQRMERQIVPDSFIFSLVEFTVLLGGLAFGARHRSVNPNRVLTLGAVTIAAGCWLNLAAVPLWTWMALQENVYLSQVWLLWPLRLGLTLPVLFPLAILFGQVTFSSSLREQSQGSKAGVLVAAKMSESAGSSTLFILKMLAFIAAWITGSWLLPALGVWRMTFIGTATLLIVAAGVCDWSFVWDEFDRLVTSRHWRKWRFVGAIALVGFTLSAPTWVRYQPAFPARVLFDGHVFAAHRQRVSIEQLPSIDEARAAIVVEGESGTLTAWKLRGTTLLVRENGIPKGSFAAQPRLAPRYLPDVLATVVPLTVFDGAQSVLLLGVRGGEPLATVSAFPVQRVLAVDADQGVVDLSRQLLADSDESAVLSDSRIETKVCEPKLALQSLREKFDVIVASPNQPSLPSAANSYTAETLSAAARCLTEDGVLVIRFAHIDLGPRPIRILSKTLASLFTHVAAVDMVPGELLFVATNSEQGFVRDGFVDRLQRPQVRNLLATCGWDWSAMLRLGLQDGDAIAAWSGHRDSVVNDAANSTWPFRLPTEVMNWDNKQQQVRTELQKHERFLMVWGGPAAETADIATRLNEWDLSRQIVRRHADEFWAYRKSVKEHMTKSSRSMIQHVGMEATESGLHPDDDRRLRYFRAIGDVTKRAHPTAAEFDRIRQFESPFDPLVTPFLHGEIADLSPRCQPRDLPNELRHRLVSVNFAVHGDRSIRNVADALLFLNENPDAVPNPAERFDHFNSLLQTLLHRWQARGAFRPVSSKIALNDIERSISAAESSFTACTAIAETRAVCPIAWKSRQEFLDRQLVRKLRSYRSDVLAHYVKNEQSKAALEQESSAEPTSE